MNPDLLTSPLLSLAADNIKAPEQDPEVANHPSAPTRDVLLSGQFD